MVLSVDAIAHRRVNMIAVAVAEGAVVEAFVSVVGVACVELARPFPPCLDPSVLAMGA
ncbi:hypothetical protein [Ferrimicrobium sp.]|uniref:hypothetical protein n=1 Tax=Ferrimicrobium sp. TaxID=2926050 RepID=UPI002606A612|nr:hypothetical protein [Ferrimicrobium sp.]